MDYELSDLIDISQLQKLLDSFYNATGISSGVVSRNGTVLAMTKWRDICTKFHRVNPESEKRCIESDKYILDQFKAGNDIVNFRCKNGLADLGAPIVIDGTFLATIFVGQVLFEEPDIEYFKKQANEFGFDEESYLYALKDIPVVDKEEHEKIINFLKDFAQMVGDMGLRQLNLLEAQNKLKLSDERYRLAIDGSNDGIWDWCFVDNICFASDRFLEILGYSFDEMNSLITYFIDLVHPEDRPYYKEKYIEHLKGKSNQFCQEVRIKTKSNNYKWVLIRGAVVFSDEGNSIRISGSLTDLSDKKSAEELIEKEQYLSNTIIDNSNIIICIWDKDGTLVKFNKYGERIYGYSRKEVLGYKWISTPLREIGEKILNYIKKPSTNVIQEEGSILCKNGDLINVLWINQILTNKDGSVKNIISMGLDITERVNEEKRLTEFFANISHELKTPLNIIFSSLQLVESYLSKGLISENIDKIMNCKKGMKQNCYRLLRLVNNLIDITKIDAGYLSLNMDKCNIVSLVEDITLSIADYVESKNLNLIFDTDVEEKFIFCDPDNIERIILNLLSNSIKFTKPGDSILVSLQDKGDNILISVVDTGIGIEKDKLDVIFERFKQVNKSFTRDHEGSGIGLSLVKSLVEMHGGSIKVNSISGEGSEFIIELPTNTLDYEEIYLPYKELYKKQDTKIEKINIEFSDIYFT